LSLVGNFLSHNTQYNMFFPGMIFLRRVFGFGNELVGDFGLTWPAVGDGFNFNCLGRTFDTSEVFLSFGLAAHVEECKSIALNKYQTTI